MRILILTLLLTGLSGCTTRMLYDTAQQTQLAECRKIADIDAQRRCIQRNSTSYDTYKAQTEPVAKP
jgi:hypothetical protein